MTSIQSRKRRSDEADLAEALAFTSSQAATAAAGSAGLPPADAEQNETRTSCPNPTAAPASRPMARISTRSYTPSRLGVASAPLEKKDPEAAPAPSRFLGRLLNRHGSPGPKSAAQTPARASPIPSRLRAERKSTLAATPSSPRQGSPRTPQGEDWVAAQSTKRSRVMEEGDLISSAPRSSRAGSARGTPSSAARLKAFVETIFSPLYKLFPRRQKGAVTLPATAKTLFPDPDAAAATNTLLSPLPLALPAQSSSPTTQLTGAAPATAGTAATATSQNASPTRLGPPIQHSPSTPGLASAPLTLLNGQSPYPSQSPSAAGVVLGVSPGRARPGSPAAREQHEYVAGINLQDEEFLFMAEFLCELPTPGPQCGPPLLPEKRTSARHTLVLDLDETLVHCSTEVMAVYNMTLPVVCNGRNYTVYVRTRPHLQTFLAAVASSYEVVLFTASQKAYADKLAAKLDPDGRCFSHRLFREHCVRVADNYVKDLSALGRPLSSTLIVDNSPLAFAYQPSNAIPIVSWYDDEQDRELLKLLSFLEYLSARNLDDVRPFLRSIFRLPERTF